MRRWITLGMMTLLAAALFSQVLAQSGTAATLPPFIAALRADMELIADEVFGSGQRPELWTGSADTTSPSIIADIWFDNEQLADEVFGRGQRPADWIGATSSNPALVTRNVRHDLEVLADAVGGTDVRPPGWTGAAPFHRCSRTVLNLVYLLETVYATGIRTAPDTPG
ncbi:MAG: hypothetical protein MUE40_21700, partial [Anaerolineae bacterium]|nr:hypothetical protein [Anaerolineae bacterium]